MQVDVSGRGKTLSDSLAAMEIQGVALRLTGVLGRADTGVTLAVKCRLNAEKMTHVGGDL